MTDYLLRRRMKCTSIRDTGRTNVVEVRFVCDTANHHTEDRDRLYVQMPAGREEFVVGRYYNVEVKAIAVT